MQLSDFFKFSDETLKKVYRDNALKIIGGKAPIALKIANQIIEDGYKKPLKEAVKEELAHLMEIFATKDALTGLTSVGKRPKFEGK